MPSSGSSTPAFIHEIPCPNDRAVTAVPSFAAPPEGFDARVEALRKQIGVPGMAIAIVENGKVTLAKGYGVKKLGSSDPVDADTIFPTGSTGKAFTVADLAILVDQGKIGWDDKVIDHLPGFQMYDPWVTREITIRDLLVHRSGLGLGEGDLLFVPREQPEPRRNRQTASLPQAGDEFSLRLRLRQRPLHGCRPAHRSGHRENLGDLYGREISQARRHAPLHERRRARRFQTPNRAQPHARHQRRAARPRRSGTARRARRSRPQRRSRRRPRDQRQRHGALAPHSARARQTPAERPAPLQRGGARGNVEAGDYSSRSVRCRRNSPSTQPIFCTYALGWDVQDYRGAQARLARRRGPRLSQPPSCLLPEKNVGFAIEINSEDGEIIVGLTDELLDHYLGLPNEKWPEKFIAYAQKKKAEGAERRSRRKRPSPPRSAHPFRSRATPGLMPIPGMATSRSRRTDGKPNDRLQVYSAHERPARALAIRHLHHPLHDKTIEPAYVTFALDAEGKIDRITMKPSRRWLISATTIRTCYFHPLPTKK